MMSAANPGHDSTVTPEMWCHDRQRNRRPSKFTMQYCSAPGILSSACSADVLRSSADRSVVLSSSLLHSLIPSCVLTSIINQESMRRRQTHPFLVMHAMHVPECRVNTFRVVTLSACSRCLTFSIACSSSDIDVHASDPVCRQPRKLAMGVRPADGIWSAMCCAC